MKRIATSFLLCSLFCSLVAGAASAQAGPAVDGLPGVHRVGSAHLGDRMRLALTGWGGYGWIPGREDEAGDHHRALGNASISFVPIEFAALSLGTQGYYDVHPDDAEGADTSGVGELFFAVRGAVPLPEGFAAGADLRWDLPGGDAPSLSAEASRVSVRGLVSLRPDAWDVELDLAIGYRYDGTARSIQDMDALRPGDRVSLGVSTVEHSLLLGLGANVTLSPAELFFEATYEPYVGDGAPPGTAAPLRGVIGARLELIPGLRAHLALEATAHRRLRSDAMAPWTLPSEPRVAVMLGFSFRPALDADPAAAEEEVEVEEEEEEATPPPPDELTVTGVVNDPDGAPIAGARVALERGEGEALGETETDAQGRYRFEHVSRGPMRVRIRAEGFDERVRDLEVPAGGAEIETGAEALARVERAGALRGLVRDFGGTPLRAEIVVQPGDHRTQADDAGTFELQVPPGQYEVEVTAPGFTTQRRQVTVEANGVVILNVDLRSARSR